MIFLVLLTCVCGTFVIMSVLQVPSLGGHLGDVFRQLSESTGNKFWPYLSEWGDIHMSRLAGVIYIQSFSIKPSLHYKLPL